VESTEATSHSFNAIAFVDNVPIREWEGLFPGGRASPHELVAPLASGGTLFAFPFGALVFLDASPERREAELARLSRERPRLRPEVVRESFVAFERAGEQVGLRDGRLIVDSLTPGRAGIIALTVGQSAAMEYYERIVEDLSSRTRVLVERLEIRGIVPMRTRQLHRFIGEAIGTRSEVLSVLHLLDRPDATWDDPAMDRIYGDLRGEFDLVDRYGALESKLKSVQEALELLLGTARDRRLVALEAAIVVLIVIEIVLGLFRAG
jgi:required for meiotic nuclear division protein 1